MSGSKVVMLGADDAGNVRVVTRSAEVVTCRLSMAAAIVESTQLTMLTAVDSTPALVAMSPVSRLPTLGSSKSEQESDATV
jgi:hypothetical protein